MTADEAKHSLKEGKKVMTKEEFVKRRTDIISEMLDNQDEVGIYPTSVCFAKLDDLFDEITKFNSDEQLILSNAQILIAQRKIRLER